MSHAFEVQKAILDAAFHAFATDGPDATLSGIADASGVGRATLYRYFPGGRDNLIQALVTRETLTLIAELGTLMDEHAADSAAEQLHIGLTTAYERLKTNPALQRVLTDAPGALLPYFTVGAAPVVELGVDFLAPYIERGIKAGKLPQMDVRHAAEWCVRFLISLLVTPPVTADPDDSASMDRFMSIVTRFTEVRK